MSAESADAAVTLSGVRKAYGRVVALSGVDLSLDFGDVHCLAGPNGSGKTTLLRLAAGLARPTAGRVTVTDAPMGYAFQRPSAYPDLTVAENLATFGRLGGVDDERGERLAERLRLAPALDRRTSALSDGYAKKVDLVLAFLKSPPVVLLDEPLADLDDVTRRRLVELVADYRRADRLVVVSSHNIEWFDDAVSRLTVVCEGRVVTDVRTADIDRPPHEAYGDAVTRFAGD